MMRLLARDNKGDFYLTIFDNKIPRYAILSHRWEAGELTFEDLKYGSGKLKAGYQKLVFCGEQASRDGLGQNFEGTPGLHLFPL
jgi:hypothetical protein